ncbi:MAG: hypothetical protein LC620_06695 [Halobacteriales archaeon]|nr:hypothetical protein [Halobacteriales archaeon]
MAAPTPEKAMGRAYLRHERGEITKVQLDQALLQARLAAVDPRRRQHDLAYA